MSEINPAERRSLRARAHALHPVVTISENGLSPAVLREIERNLAAHELIKVRVFSDDRAQREAYLEEICKALNAVPVQHIGKLLVVWRQSDAPAAPHARRRREPRRTKRSFQGNERR